MVIDKTCRYVSGIALAILTIFLLAGGAGALSNDGGGSWSYYKEITISNTGAALSDYQVLVNLSGAGFPLNANKSGADIRFTDAGGKELAYWVESWDYANKSAKVWVNVTSVAAGGSAVRMCYGNPSATKVSNGENTFIFFDDFPGTFINWSKWNLSSTKPCSMPYDPDGLETLEIDANGNLHISESGSYWCGLRSENIAFPEDWAYSVKLKVDADTNFQAFGVDWTAAAFVPYDTTGYPDPYDKTTTYNTSYETKSANVDATSWGEYIIIRNNTGVYFYDKGSLENIHINQVPSAGGNRTLHFTVAGGRHMYVEHVKIRKFASPEPSVSVGAEQNAGIIADDFEDGNLSEYKHEILVTWAVYSFAHGIVDDNGNKVAFIKGGIDNGGGGNQILIRKDLNSTDTSIKSRIKMVLNPDHVNYYPDRGVIAGIAGRYQSIGKGYGAFIFYDIQNSKVSLALIRMDGTQPGPNYEYNTKHVYLKDPVVLTNFDPLQWHTLQLDLQGSSITVKLDGKVYLQATDSNYTQGSPGLLFWGSDGSAYTHYDDFAIATMPFMQYPSFNITPQHQKASIGQNFTLNITVAPSNTPVYSAEFILKFDPSKLEAINITQGKFLSQDGASTMVVVNKIDNALGEITYGETRVSVNTGVTSQGTLASAAFRVKSDAVPGMSYLNFTKAQLSDAQAEPIPNITVNNGSVNIIVNQPPVAVITKPWNARVIRGEKDETFDASASYDVDGIIVSYKWDFGDGNSSISKLATYQYTSYKYYGEGYHPFNLTLTVTDDKGASSSIAQSITPILPGDANLDGKVDIYDAALVGLNWGRKVLAILLPIVTPTVGIPPLP